MKKEKQVMDSTIKLGHGIHRAKKTTHLERTRRYKHEKKWIEDKMDNK